MATFDLTEAKSFVQCTAGDEVNLPDVRFLPEGFEAIVSSIGDGDTTLTPATNQTIGGETSYTLTSPGIVKLLANGYSNWLIEATGASSGDVVIPPVEEDLAKLTTADVFSDWVKSGLVGTAPVGGLTRHASVAVGEYYFESVAVSSDGAYLYGGGSVGAFGSRVYKIDLSTYAVVATYTPPMTVSNYNWVLTDDTYVYILSDQVAYKVDTATMTLVDSVAITSLGNNSSTPSMTPDRLHICYSLDSNSVVIINTADLTYVTFNTAEGDAPTCSFGNSAVLVGVVDSGNSTQNLVSFSLSGVEGSTLVTGISQFMSIRGMAVSDDLEYVAFGGGDNNLSIYSLSTGLLVQTHAFGPRQPWQPVWVGSTAYVALDAGGTLALGSLDLNGNFTETSLPNNPNYGISYKIDTDGTAVYFSAAKAPSYADTDVYAYTPASTTITIPSGVAIVDGLRTTAAEEVHTYTASKDTYDFLQSDGTWIHSEVDNDDAAPTETGLLVQKVVTDGTSITAVTQVAPSSPAELSAGGGSSVEQYIERVTATGDYTVDPSNGTDQLIILDGLQAGDSIVFPSSESNQGMKVVVYTPSIEVPITFADVSDSVWNTWPNLQYNDCATFVATNVGGSATWLQTDGLFSQFANLANGSEWSGDLNANNVRVTNLLSPVGGCVGTGTLSGSTTVSVSASECHADSFVFVTNTTSANGLWVSLVDEGNFTVTGTDGDSFNWFVVNPSAS